MKELFYKFGDSKKVSFDWKSKTYGAAFFFALIALTVLAPFLNDFSIYFVFKGICHQDPARCFYINEHPFAVCVRCFAIYLGTLFGFIIIKESSEIKALFLLILSLFINLIQFFFERLLIIDLSNDLNIFFKVLTGFILGVSLAIFLLMAISDIIYKKSKKNYGI